MHMKIRDNEEEERDMRSRRLMIVALLTLMIGMVPLGGSQVFAAGVTR